MRGQVRHVAGLVAVGLALVTLCTPSASALVWKAPPRNLGWGETSLIENPDGTFTRWRGTGIGKPAVRSYSYTAGEVESLDRRWTADQFDSGTITHESGAEVDHVTTGEVESAKHDVEILRTGEPYKSAGEADLGDELIAADESTGTLPSLADSIGVASGQVIAAGGAAYLGVTIGNGIDRLIGLPTLPFGGFSEGETTPSESILEWRTYQWTWLDKWRFEAKTVCGGVKCETLSDIVEAGTRSKYVGESHIYESTEDIRYGSTWSTGGGPSPKEIPECPPPGPIGVECEPSGPAKAHTIYITLPKGHDAAFPCACSGLLGHGTNSGEPTPEDKLFPMPELTRPFPSAYPSGPTHERVDPTPPLGRDFILTEHKTELPPITESETEAPAPEPITPPSTLIEVPQPEPAEVGTHYESRVETRGFTHVRLNVLPDTEIDTEVGPNEVAKVTPVGGTLAAPATEVVIDVNPSNAPEPGGGGEGGGGVGSPTEPGIHLPHFAVLCTRFPFGVPCWLVETFASWSASSETPTFTIGGFTIDGTHIPEANVSLAPLEPIMVILRPMLVVFATIGLVILFYRFATGSGAGKGGDASEDV